MIRDKIKSLASDTLTYGIFQTLGRFLSFLLTPLYSNYLSQDENGVVAYLFAIIALIVYIYSFGMEASFFRFFKQGDEANNRKVFSVSFLTITLISFSCTLLIVLFSGNLASSIIGDTYQNAQAIIQVAALIPLFDMLMVIPYGRLRMLHRVKRFAITRFCIILLSVTLNVFFLIFTELGILGVFFAQLIASFVGTCIFLPDIIKSLDFNFDKKLFKEMLKFGLPTLPASLSTVAMQMLDRPIMKLFTNDAQIGIYQINAKLAIPMMLMVTIFDYAWRPFYLSHYKDEEAPRLFGRVLTYFTLVCAAVFLFVTLFIDNIVRIPLWNGRYFIHQDYWHAMYIVPILLFGYFFSGVTNNFAAVFHIEKKTKYLPIAISLSAVISVVLNFTLIPKLGILGASIALLIAYFSGAALMKFFQRKVNFKVDYEWRRIALIFLATFIVFAIGKYIIYSFDLYIAFVLKLLCLVLFFILLKLLGFFTKSELQFLKNFIRRR